MTRSEVLGEISAIVRNEWWGAVFAVGYLGADASTEVLEALLAALREHPGPIDRPGHLEAYRERWGRVPDRGN